MTDVTKPDVTSIAWCRFELANLPVDHLCIGGDSPSCPTEAGHPCGTCPACITAQREDLARRDHREDLAGGAW